MAHSGSSRDGYAARWRYSAVKNKSSTTELTRGQDIKRPGLTSASSQAGIFDAPRRSRQRQLESFARSKFVRGSGVSGPIAARWPNNESPPHVTFQAGALFTSAFTRRARPGGHLFSFQRKIAPLVRFTARCKPAPLKYASARPIRALPVTVYLYDLRSKRVFTIRWQAFRRTRCNASARRSKKEKGRRRRKNDGVLTL